MSLPPLAESVSPQSLAFARWMIDMWIAQQTAEMRSHLPPPTKDPLENVA